MKITDLKNYLATKEHLCKDLTAAQDRIKMLEGAMGSASGRSAGVVAELTAELTAARGRIATLEGEVSRMTAEAAALKTSARTVADATIEKLAELGVSLADMPKSSGAVADDRSIYDTWKSLAGGEKQAYFRANRGALDRFMGAHDANDIVIS